MKERIKKIRKDKGLNQEEFARSIGLTRQMIAFVETDRASFSDRSIGDICRVHNVNEEWLRTGFGEPYRSGSREQEIADFIASSFEENDDFKLQLIYGLSKLSVEDWEDIARIIKKLNEK